MVCAFFCAFGSVKKMTMDEPHAGEMIKAELQRQGRTITWLAKQLGYSRENMYKIFNRKWIYSDLLLRISVIMDCDFFRLYSEYYKNKKNVN